MAHDSRRPLVNYASNASQRKSDDLYILEEESEQAILARVSSWTSSRGFRRFIIIIVTIPCLLFLARDRYSLPTFREQRSPYRRVDGFVKEGFTAEYGISNQPATHGLVHLRQLEKKYLPSKIVAGQTARRLIIVGNIRGAKDELVALLDKMSFKSDYDHLVVTGDMIAKGPDSAGVVALLRSVSASCVRGNYEDRILTFLASSQRSESDRYAGEHVAQKGALLRSIENNEAIAVANQLSSEDLSWLADCPVLLNLGSIAGLPFKNIVVAHAGLVPDVPLNKQDPYYVMNMQSINAATLVPSSAREKGVPWYRVWNQRQQRKPNHTRSLVIYGHDTRGGLAREKYSVGLDTGCVLLKGGRLTALVVQAGEDGKMNTASVKCRNYVHR